MTAYVEHGCHSAFYQVKQKEKHLYKAETKVPWNYFKIENVTLLKKGAFYYLEIQHSNEICYLEMCLELSLYM